MDYDVVIPAAEKDFNKLPFLIDSLAYLRPLPKWIYVIIPDSSPPPLIIHPQVIVTAESYVMPPGMDPKAAQGFRRPQWIYQQFIKLFQSVSRNDYLIVDSDLIFNREFPLLDKNGKPQFFMGNDQNHRPYFEYSEAAFGFGRIHKYSFISEVMLFNRGICHELLNRYCVHNGLTELINEHPDKQVRHLYNSTTVAANDSIIPADYEIYGNFVELKYPELYSKKKISTRMFGQYDFWKDDVIKALVKDMSIRDLDTFTIHTWI